ncbi:MAG TPA: CAP domain-containing protein [Cytophagaceae bacterium]
MSKKFYPFIFLAFMLFSATTSPVIKVTDNDICLNSEEEKLFKLIQEYRKSEGLPPIPFSVALTKVAKAHVKDLNENHPDIKNCNAHSWSDKGQWKGCCYTSDHKEASCMWNKPRELTNYKGNGYEIAFGSSDPIYRSYIATAEDALDGWKNSPGHNNVILNKEIWKKSPWKGMGLAVSGSFAVVWFGEEPDENSKFSICK